MYYNMSVFLNKTAIIYVIEKIQLVTFLLPHKDKAFTHKSERKHS